MFGQEKKQPSNGQSHANGIRVTRARSTAVNGKLNGNSTHQKSGTDLLVFGPSARSKAFVNTDISHVRQEQRTHPFYGCLCHLELRG